MSILASTTIEYENFCDTIISVYKKGMFMVYLGQTLPQAGDKWLARFWIDPAAFKEFLRVFKEQVEKYENDHGAIEK